MEKLDKVIAGLRYCINPNTDCEVCDDDCPYLGKRDGHKVCVDFLMSDALEMLKELSADNQRLREMWAKVTKNLSMAIAERDAALEKLSWLEEKPVPMDNGEYVSEAPREGM